MFSVWESLASRSYKWDVLTPNLVGATLSWLSVVLLSCSAMTWSERRWSCRPLCLASSVSGQDGISRPFPNMPGPHHSPPKQHAVHAAGRWCWSLRSKDPGPGSKIVADGGWMWMVAFTCSVTSQGLGQQSWVDWSEMCCIDAAGKKDCRMSGQVACGTQFLLLNTSSDNTCNRTSTGRKLEL